MRSVIALSFPTVTISQDEREFFVQLGVSQPTVNAYMLGQRRVQMSALPLLARPAS